MSSEPKAYDQQLRDVARRHETERKAQEDKRRAERRTADQERRKLEGLQNDQLGALARAMGVFEALPIKAIAGVLLSALEQSRKQPELVVRWADSGGAWFRDRARRAGGTDAAGGEGNGRGSGPADPGGAGSDGEPTPGGEPTSSGAAGGPAGDRGGAAPPAAADG